MQRVALILLIKEGDILDEIVNDLNLFNEQRQSIQKDILSEIIETMILMKSSQKRKYL